MQLIRIYSNKIFGFTANCFGGWGGGVNPSLDPRRWIAWDIFSNQWPHFLFEVTNPLQIVLFSYTVLLDIVDKGLGAS